MTESSTGSFAFPPDNLQTADQMRDFFLNAPISDQILSNAQYAYKRMQRQADIDRRHQGFMRGNKALHALESRDYREYLQARDDLLTRARHESELSFTPNYLPANGIRAILRARQLWNYSVQLADPEEQESARNTLISIQGQQATATAITAHYQTQEWVLSGVLSESDLAVSDAIQLLVSR